MQVEAARHWDHEDEHDAEFEQRAAFADEKDDGRPCDIKLLFNAEGP